MAIVTISSVMAFDSLSKLSKYFRMSGPDFKDKSLMRKKLSGLSLNLI